MGGRGGPKELPGTCSDFTGVSRGGALESQGVGLSAVTGQDSARRIVPFGPFRKHFSKDFKAT